MGETVQWIGPVALGALLWSVCLIAWLSNLIALPGNWISVLLVSAYALWGPSEGPAAIGLGVVLSCFLIAFAGEIVEFLSGALGARKAGASGKSTAYSIIGSIAGAIVGAIVGLPVPLVGPVLAAVLFGGLGAAAGAMYGEWKDGRAWRENWTIGHTTFWARTFGILGKFSIGLVLLVVVLVALLI